MNDNTCPTLLEQLPVEIVLQVFASFTLREIIVAFSSLNSHIDSCIQAVTNATHILPYNFTRAEDALHLFPTQIGRLVITNSPTVDFTSLINLRSLTLKYGTLTQFNGIRPQHFPQLEILHLCDINGNSTADNTKSFDNLFQEILSNGFVRLRICTAVRFHSLSRNRAWTGSPSLRVLTLDLQILFDYEQIRSLCPNLRLQKRASQRPLDPQTAIYIPQNRRLLSEFKRLQEWESEKKFILDSWPIFTMATGGVLDWRTDDCIRGRIFPEKDPYCFASFLIEIKLPPEYPFKPPRARIADRIYHPSIGENGSHCCCWGFGPDSWHPTTSLVDFIKGVLRIINFDSDHHSNSNLANEYRDHYDEFYEKALRYTLTYGQPR